MSKNMEKQGKRVGYIIGGIFALLLGALLTLIYLPSALTVIAGIEPLWDFYDLFESVLGQNFMEMFLVWGPAGVLILLAGVYFVCLFARPSTASTMFRLSAMFGCLSLAVPQVAVALLLMKTEIDITSYANYILFGLYILCFIFYVIGFVARIKQKYHKNRPSTTLTFASTFWMLLGLFPMLQVVNILMNADIQFFVDASTIVSQALMGIIAVFLVVSAIWMFCTVPHRVVVDYNPDTRYTHRNGRPKVLASNETVTTYDQAQREPFQSSQPQSYATQSTGFGAPQNETRFAHNYGNQQNGFAQNPVFNQAPAQQTFTQPTYTQQQNNFAGQTQPSFTQPQQNNFARPAQQGFAQPQPNNVAQPQQPNINRAPQPAPQRIVPNQSQQNPYASYNNFAQNSPYNRPQPVQQTPPSFQTANQQQVRPQVNTNSNPVQPARPNMPNTLPQGQRPAQPQARPNPFSQPQRPVQAGRPGQPQSPRPPVTPFTTPKNPNNNGNNNAV